jgi:hypothetical protein
MRLVRRFASAALVVTLLAGALAGQVAAKKQGTITCGEPITHDNADLGIEAVEGVIDGGRNRASGNGDPLQCLNDDCS